MASLRVIRVVVLAALLAEIGFVHADLQPSTGVSVGTNMVVFCPVPASGADWFQLGMVNFCPFGI